MPFDYNSFMQGVQTGLRLGRTKLGRQPPVPSGMYILTESGIKVVTEKVGSARATFYSINPNPKTFITTAYDSYYYNSSVVYTGLETEFRHYDREHNPAPTNTQFFFWIRVRNLTPTITYKTVHLVLLWEDSRYDHDYYQFITRSLSHSIREIHLSANEQPFVAGNYRYVTASTMQFDDEEDKRVEVFLRIDNATMFEGTDAELAAFIAGLSGTPMITEGS